MKGKSVARLSVVFPVYDNLDVVRVTLPAILAQTLAAPLSHEVIVVDDGSGPALKDWLATISDPRCRVVTLARNMGRAAARNAGVRAASGAAVVFLDSDVIVRPDFLAAHAATLGLARTAAKGADISLGRLTDTDHLAPAAARPPPAALPGTGHFTSANVAVRRALLDAVQETPQGPFDEIRFTRYGWEDLELERRLARHAPRRARSDGAIGFHVCAPFALGNIPAMIRKEKDRAAMARVFYAKHPSFSVRMVTQMTPLHRLLWEILSLGGLLNEQTLAPLLRWLAAHGNGRLAEVIVRHAILNPFYVRAL